MSALTNHRHEVALTGLWHDYANLFPMLDAAAQDRLRDDIRQFGVREPIVLFNGRILDGRNRYMAARDLGLEFPVADYAGTDAEALAYVLSTNLHRRHLTESQRAAVAAKLANMPQGARTDLEPSANLRKVSTAEAATMLNVGTRTVEAAKAVLDHGAPELAAQVESGEVAVSAAAEVARLPGAEQAEVVAAGPQAVKARAKTIRDERKAKSTTANPHPTRALTREALTDDLAGLREENAELRSKLVAAEARIADLERANAELAHSESGRIIADLQAQRDREKAAKGKKMDELAVEARKLRAADKRIADLERELAASREREAIPL
ncbi:hypothetical protein DRW48_10380 [Paracoccus suum]|uniref:ParB/Sulfiredoxin domain-containing protein n=1 Tax=Paracoccus suum TaxID=2259340 RepID=A0A344PKY8_9RHOB|nr:hypothetical protein [Paracoccus suum]AXC50043.1 hypothetical protein DRW48_10380 [Paracoccus suum]